MRWYLLIIVMVGGLYLWARHVASAGDEQAAFDAVDRGDGATLATALDHGVDVNASRFPQGQTLLMAAATFGHADAVRELLARGADPNRGNDAGYSPIMLAAGCGHTDVVRILVKAGANTRGVSPVGKTAAAMAIDCGHPEVVVVLCPSSHAD